MNRNRTSHLCLNWSASPLSVKLNRQGDGIKVSTTVSSFLLRVLEDLWGLLLKLIIDALDSNRDVSVEFFGRFYYTLEVN